MIRRRSFETFDNAVLRAAGNDLQSIAYNFGGLMVAGIGRNDNVSPQIAGGTCAFAISRIHVIAVVRREACLAIPEQHNRLIPIRDDFRQLRARFNLYLMCDRYLPPSFVIYWRLNVLQQGSGAIYV